MFPAIGGHGLGMCDFLDDYGIDPLKRASLTLGIDLESVGKHGPKERFDLMHNAKSIIYAQSVAIAEMLKENKILPHVSVGYSLGEYAALNVAGVFKYQDALKFLYQVLEMNRNLDILSGAYGMALVRGPEKDELEIACERIRHPDQGKKGRPLYLSCINAPKSHMVSGDKQAFPLLSGMFKRIRILDGSINIPSHSPLVTHMEKICTPYLETLLLTAKKPEIKFISSVTGEYIRDIKTISQNLRCLLSSRLNWIDAVHTMIQSGINTFIEVGHKSGLTNQIQLCVKDLGGIDFFYTDNKKNLDRTLTSLCK